MLNQAYKDFIKENLSNTESLKEYLSKKNSNKKLSRKITKSLQNITVGKSKKNLLSKIIVEPTICSISENYLILVSIINTKNNKILGVAHSSIEKNKWLTLVNNKDAFQKKKMLSEKLYKFLATS